MAAGSRRKAQKTTEGDPINLDRWLVSYADFITLLFTFFVMMYAVSSLNEGKYRTISHAIVATFRHREPRARLHVLFSPNHSQSGLATSKTSIVLTRALESLTRTASSPKDISVVETFRHLRVRIQAGFLFREGRAHLRKTSRPVLAALARLLATSGVSFRVEGHTDSLPVHGRYRNNWALSGARAVNVLSFLLSAAPIDPRKTSTVAFGSSRPLVPNDTSDHRRQNRRVEIVILKK
ncbi:MAG: flagellar motor protein MotB [Nitrospiraceae bacterium]|nr:flagellar motor protein MotB [Nitrospiraceae bacterium]